MLNSQINNKSLLKIKKSFIKKRRPIGQTICTYPAMIPPEIANYFINIFSNENDIVYDPFAGRGNIALEAAILKRQVYASDLNPLALCLTNFKLTNSTKEWFQIKFQKFWNTYDQNKNYVINDAKFLNIYFNWKTLNEICFIRQYISKNKNKFSNALSAIVLSILHGPEKRDGSSSFLSVSMNNGYFMSPNYVQNYKIKFNLKLEYRNTYNLILERSSKIYDTKEKIDVSSKCFKKNALNSNLENKAKLVLTSPPYSNIVRYKKSNLLRNWFLGEEINDIKKDKSLSDNLPWNEYIIFLNNFLKNIEKNITGDGYIILVVGNILSNHSTKKVSNHISEILKDSNLCLNAILIDKIQNNNKLSRSLGNRRGQKTKEEQIIILSKNNNFDISKILEII